ncbi:MAG: glycosyltransferase family A protein [Acidimicrobiia bacterium]
MAERTGAPELPRRSTGAELDVPPAGERRGEMTGTSRFAADPAGRASSRAGDDPAARAGSGRLVSVAPDVPLVSVVIPCHGNAATLAESIRSAQGQTHPRVEVIVVNDGSPDDTSLVASSFPGVILVEQGNTGPAGARNAGVRVASGEFVAVLDADDVLTPEVIDRRLAMMREDPSIGIVVGHHREMDLEGNLLDRIPEVRNVPADGFFTVVARSFPPVGWIIRREAIPVPGPYDPTLEPCEDWDLLIRIAARWRVGYDAVESQLYRVTPGSLSTNFDRGFRSSRRVMAKNAALSPSALGYRVARTKAGFFEARYILGRIRLLPSWRDRVIAFCRTTWRAPMFLPYGLAVLGSYPIWRRRVGL